MALTSAEEAMVRQLLDQQASILSLAGNEPTITSKLGATKVTLSDLPPAVSILGPELLLVRQGLEDKTISASLLASELAAEAATGQQKKQQFTAGIDYTPGSTITITLTELPIAPSGDALKIHFDAAYQQESEWSYNPGTGVITFGTAIPIGVGKVEASWVTPLAIGTPADGTVTTAKIADGGVTTEKLASTLITGATEDSAPDVTADYVLTHDASAGGLKKVLARLFSKAVLRASQATTSGTSVDFTAIPSNVDEIDVLFNAVSTNGAGSASLLVQIGSGSVQSSGYASYAGSFNNANQTAALGSSAGFLVTTGQGAASTHHGVLQLRRVSGNLWVAAGSGGGLAGDSSNVARSSGGSVTLSGAIDRVRLTTSNGTDTFDAGNVTIIYR